MKALSVCTSIHPYINNTLKYLFQEDWQCVANQRLQQVYLEHVAPLLPLRGPNRNGLVAWLVQNTVQQNRMVQTRIRTD